MTNIISQNLRPRIAPFKGEVYSIPDEKKTIGFGSYLDSLAPLYKVEYKRLNIPDRIVEKPFPNVRERYGFGMILKSTMKIDTIGFYDFHLTSDDGSRLWINGKLIIDNDGDHKMTLKSDTVLLEKGIHKVKIWYYQAYAMRYGLIFDYNFQKHHHSTKLEDQIEIQDVHFRTGMYKIDVKEKLKLINQLNDLDIKNIKQVNLQGHTDNVGNDQSNIELSKKRANAVSALIKDYLIDISISVKSFGESTPISSNATIKSKALNRRVSIELVYY